METKYANIGREIIEDFLYDNIFSQFDFAKDHNYNGKRHLIGMVTTEEDGASCIVDVKWRLNSNEIEMTILAVQPTEDFDYVSDCVYGQFDRKIKDALHESVGAKCSQCNGVMRIRFYRKTY